MNQRVRAGDIGWLREQHARGELSWLTPHLGQEGYRDLGLAIDAGDVDLVGRRIGVLGDSTTLIGDDPTLLVSRRGAVLPASAVRRERNTLVVVGILLAVIAPAIVAFLLLLSSDDSSDTTVLASDTTLPTDTIAPDSVVGTVLETIPGIVRSPRFITSFQRAGCLVARFAVQPGHRATLERTGAVALRHDPTGGRNSHRTAIGNLRSVPHDDRGGRSHNELRTMKNVTILAPTESAFTALPPDVQIALRSPANRAVLARIVRYRVLTQTRTAAQLTPGNYPTAEGTPVNVQSVNGAIRINDATIIGPDVKVANGVLHAVDRLLIPPTVDLNTIVAKPGTPTPSPTTAAIAPTGAAPTLTTSPAATAAPVTSAPSTPPATVLTVASAATSPASTSPASTTVATTLAPTTVASTSRPPTTSIP